MNDYSVVDLMREILSFLVCLLILVKFLFLNLFSLKDMKNKVLDLIVFDSINVRFINSFLKIVKKIVGFK